MDSYIISPVTKTRFIYSLQFEKLLFEVAFQNGGALSVRTIVLSPDMSDNSPLLLEQADIRFFLSRAHISSQL